ncbi:MAG: hypothetical protein OEV94_10760 [Deltaproteobacteria bacterium]|nr:hypothetical protein [Deltaproteobacteria bacterium]
MDTQPWLELSFRQSPVGGDTQEAHGDITALGEALAGDPALGVVFLVHGFNVTQAEGREAYRGMNLAQGALAPGRDNTPLASGRQVVQVFWAGDLDAPELARPAFYPFAIGRARETGRLFAAFLSSLGAHRPADQPLSVEFIGHSMGCRVILETLKNLPVKDRLWIHRVLYLAAAVPTHKLETGKQGDLRPTWLQWSQGEIPWHSLHSWDDLVLTYAFPLGQSLGGPGEGVLPTALGRNHCWIPLPYFQQTRIAHAGHSDYWGNQLQNPGGCSKEETQANKDAAWAINQYMGFTQGGPRESAARETAARAVMEAQSAGLERTTPQVDL